MEEMGSPGKQEPIAPKKRILKVSRVFMLREKRKFFKKAVIHNAFFHRQGRGIPKKKRRPKPPLLALAVCYRAFL